MFPLLSKSQKLSPSLSSSSSFLLSLSRVFLPFVVATGLGPTSHHHKFPALFCLGFILVIQNLTEQVFIIIKFLHQLSVFSRAMDDEIEAFMSVYAEDALLDSLPLDSFEHNIAVTVRQRGALDAASSFVEAIVHILLPATYPESSFPTVRVTRVSGLNDEGKEFNKQISEFLESDQIELGDDILFSLMEIMINYLDSANDGECLICLSSLLSNPNDTPLSTKQSTSKKPLSLRTTCFHCFHVQCLTRWGAMHISSEYVKAADKEGTVEGRASRAMQVQCVCVCVCVCVFVSLCVCDDVRDATILLCDISRLHYHDHDHDHDI